MPVSPSNNTSNDKELGSPRGRMKRGQREQILKWLARPGNAKLWFGIGKGKGKGKGGGFQQTAYDLLAKDIPFVSKKSPVGLRTAIKKLKEARDAIGAPNGPKIVHDKDGGGIPVVMVTSEIIVSKNLLENAFADIPRDNNSHQIAEEPTPRGTSEDTAAETDTQDLENVENATGLITSLLSLPTTATEPAETVSSTFPGRLRGSSSSPATNINEFRKRRDYELEKERRNERKHERMRERFLWRKDEEAEELRNEREHERMRERYQWRKEEDERRSLYERESQTLRRLQDEEDHRKKLERADELHKRRLEQEEEIHRLRLKRMRYEFMKEHGISIDRI